ncbi:cyclic nucleotide-binding domain-containing protein [Methylocystis sp. H15]|uniref:cyclic nucleotide-binding domain-containing protein n=2 Tax=unclassified Methylocystis TaxID=2625913 RepID=UPI0032B27A8C
MGDAEQNDMTLDDDIDNLARIPLFSIFEPNALRMLALSAETRLLRAGDVLFRRGEMSDGGYVLTLGSIALTAANDGRPRSKIVRPWTLIGETALLAPSTRPAGAIAQEPATVLKILRPLFHLILEQHPATAARVRDFFRCRLLDFIHDIGAEASASDSDVGRLT